MFQSSSNFNVDEDFLSDVFSDDFTTNEESKRTLDSTPSSPDNVVKRICIEAIIHDEPPQRKINQTLESLIIKTDNNCSKRKSENKSDKNYNRKVVQRKFPGPAGLLPENIDLNLSIKNLEDCDNSINTSEILCSQSTENIFQNGPWMKMLTEFYDKENMRLNLPEKYSISWIKSRASCKKLIGQKAPFLAAIIRKIDHAHTIPLVLFKDPTDEIEGYIDEEIWDQYSDFLLEGSVIVLKQVGVLRTHKKQYLNITLDNLVTIYSYCEFKDFKSDKSNVQTTRVQDMKVSDFIETIEDIKKRHKIQQFNENRLLEINTNFCHSKSNENSYLSGNYLRSNSSDNAINKPLFNLNNKISSVNNESTIRRKEFEDNQEKNLMNKIFGKNFDTTSCNKSSENEKKEIIDTIFSFRNNTNTQSSSTNSMNINYNNKLSQKLNNSSSDLNLSFGSCKSIESVPSKSGSNIDVIQSSQIIESVLDGIDTESLFDDF